MNQVTISGNLTRDPELRTFDSGSIKASFSVAITAEYKAKTGEMKTVTSYIECACWGRLASYVGELQKGDNVVVNGELKTESWKDKTTGANRSKTLVNVLKVDRDQRPGGKHVAAPPANERRATWTPSPGPAHVAADGPYDEIPEPPDDLSIPF